MMVVTRLGRLYQMLNENIKSFRKAKGLSQEELAIKLNVVRQTVSKWENGLSVPDSAMLISLAEALGTSVSTLLEEDATVAQSDDLKTIAQKLEIINLQLAQRQIRRKKVLQGFCVAMMILTLAVLLILFILNGTYLNWDYHDPELAVAATVFHGFEWIFVRIAPILVIIFVIILYLVKRSN